MEPNRIVYGSANEKANPFVLHRIAVDMPHSNNLVEPSGNDTFSMGYLMMLFQ
jgi:hypothetical protein